jgi:hypothetical protein
VPETGQFLRTTARRGRPAGTQLGSLDAEGYRTIAIDGVLYKAHRLAVLYMTGGMPPSHLPVDHANRMRDDNRWSNLRVVTATENIANQSRPGSYSKTPYSVERAWGGPTAAGVELIRRGVPIHDAAEQAGVTRATLSSVCKKIGLPLPPGSDRRTESPLTRRGVELIAQGGVLTHVAALLGLNKSTLVRACQRAGVAVPRGRRPKAP